jgi:hypothetical protein
MPANYARGDALTQQHLKPRDGALDLLKWLALLSMVLDHLRYVGYSVDLLYVPGRLAFPWFCLAMAANLARAPAVKSGGNGAIWAGCCCSVR